MKEELSGLIKNSQQSTLSKITDVEQSNHSLIESKYNRIVQKLDQYENEFKNKIDNINNKSNLGYEVLNKYASNFDKYVDL